MILTLGTTPAIARSMVFDRVTLDTVNRASAVYVTAAGKSVNAARALKTLGHACTCTGFVGGRTGQRLQELLSADGIETAFVEIDTPTRVCVTMIDREKTSATELVEESGAVRAADRDALLKRIGELGEGCTTMLCCGSLARGLDANFYRDATRALRARSPKAGVIVDASGAVLKAVLCEGVIVKCNRTELAACAGRALGDDATMIAALLELVAHGASAAVVSDGGKSTWACDGHTIWCIDTPTVKVVSAIGSGDAMAGGLAAGLERGLGFDEAAKLAVACGAANAQTTSPGEIKQSEVDRLLSTIVLRKIA